MFSENENLNFKILCLTGGPCAGKTSCLAILSDLFESLGWKVFRVPETAATLLAGGVVFSELAPNLQFSFQRDLLAVMLALEDTFINLAKLNAARGKKTIVICDRGVMDPSAYIDRDQWLRILDELCLDEADLRDTRYDCVVHLVTAAKGAEEFYTLANSAVRSESKELAIELDEKVMNAWNGHASYQVIDNSVQSFNEKCDLVVQAILTRLGLVTGTVGSGRIKKRKYVVQGFDWESQFPVSFKDFTVEHIYLINNSKDDIQIRMRKRMEIGSHGSPHVNMTIRHPSIAGQKVETRRNLSTREYEILKSQIDPARTPILKKRRCFLYKDKYFQIDVFTSPGQGLVLLEAYLDFESDDRKLPAWLKLTEVTDNKSFSMFELALKQ